MKQRERIQTIFLYGIFICYLFFLMKILVISRTSFMELFQNQRIIFRSVNLVPFRSIMEYVSSSTYNFRNAFDNVVGNIAIFIPLGIYLPLMKKDKRTVINFLIILTVSILVEILQGVLGIGVSDIDDIILNSLGGLLGNLGYKLILSILRSEKKTFSIITILSAILGYPVLFYLLFMVKIRL